MLWSDFILLSIFGAFVVCYLALFLTHTLAVPRGAGLRWRILIAATLFPLATVPAFVNIALGEPAGNEGFWICLIFATLFTLPLVAWWLLLSCINASFNRGLMAGRSETNPDMTAQLRRPTRADPTNPYRS